MEISREAEHFWGIVCLHCGEPFPVPPRGKARSAEAGTAAGLAPEPDERPVFLAWCPSCHREAPYTRNDVAQFSIAEASTESQPGRVYAYERVAGAQ